MQYKHLFFDLDHTLWDFEANSRQTLEELYHSLNLSERGVHDFDLFHRCYIVHNDKLWERYRNGYIKVDDHGRSNVPHIWAMGDCNGKGAFTHTSYNDYEIVADAVLGQGRRRISDRIQAYSLFTDPPLARIGMSEQEARKSGRKLLVGTRPMTRVGRAVERGETVGFIKTVADGATRELLGAAIFGVNGDEAIHCLLDTMYAKAPYTTVSDAVHIHPTVAELLPTTLQSMKAV